jgi:GH15 family glucan-1,4-alpha-glucosidase
MDVDLRWVVKCGEFDCPYFRFNIEDRGNLGMKGPGVVSEFELKESQEVIFILRQMPDDPPEHETPSQFRLRMVRDPPLSVSLMEALFRQTAKYWQNWISGSSYKGRWRENVLRSALTLKLLTYEPVCKFS